MNTNRFSVKGLPHYDIAIIGGGVNGTAIARDAAGRGFSVALFERHDLASGTSSASTKLIHGGLRYLEYGELSLVQKALAEREVFLKTAPHIVHPLRFILPVTQKSRPSWMIKLGLSLYDHLARRDVLPNSEPIHFPGHNAGKPLFGNITDGFAYSDCWVDDARLVALQAADAARNGAHIFTRMGIRDISAANGRWEIETETDKRIHASLVVNAAGPWVRQLLDRNGLAVSTSPKVRLVRGSHIVVPALYTGEQAYLLQQPDKRIVFAIPYEEKFTLIGTTDIEHTEGADTAPQCTTAEAEYLCDSVNRFFSQQIFTKDIVWSYSGVRPLFDDGRGRAAAVTRDYHLYRQLHEKAPILSVYGGKITTARALAEAAMTIIEQDIGERAAPWTKNVALPGGDMVDRNYNEFFDDMIAIYPWMPGETLKRMCRAYGTIAPRILGQAESIEMLGRDFGGGLYEAELAYLRNHEWARTAEDVLWRRSKLGLHVGPDTVTLLKRYFGES